MAAGGGVRSAVVTPGLLAFLLSPRLRANPYPSYRLLRAVDPVHRSPFGVWVVSRHADVVGLMRHPHIASDETKVDPASFTLGPLAKAFERRGGMRSEGAFAEAFRRLKVLRDPPDHPRLRAVAVKAFTPQRAEAMAPRIAELVDEVIDRRLPHGRMEVMRELGYPLPARIIAEMLGIPEDDIEPFTAHAPALAGALDPSPMRTDESVRAADRAIVELTAYLTDLIGRRRRAPGPDLVSALATTEVDGACLPVDDVVSIVILLVVAGHETTANVVGNGLLALLRHPDQLRRWREDATLDRTAVEELLRFDGPVQASQRITLETVEIGGATVPARRMLILCAGAANRDPEAFTNADRLDLGRTVNPHLAFGAGPHFCIGAGLARLEARIMLTTLIRRLPGLRLDGRPVRRPSFTIRGLEALPIAW